MRDVAVDQLPACEGIRDSIHAGTVKIGFQAFEPDEPCSFEVHLKLKSAALGAFAVFLVAVVAGKVAATFTGRGWKVVVGGHVGTLKHAAKTCKRFVKKMRISFRCRNSDIGYYEEWKKPKPITHALIADEFAAAKAKPSPWFSNARALAVLLNALA